MTVTQSSPQPKTENQKPTTKRGSVNCFYRTYKGKRLGPYYVRRWKVGRKIHREYIKPQDVERVKAECQAYREGKRNISKMLDNFNFLGTMLNRYDANKLVTPAMEDYICRIYHEGIYITGRPQMRRKVTREIIKVDGKEMIKKTIFELDGTTKVFMVPFPTNFFNIAFLTESIEQKWQRFQDAMSDIWHEVHEKPKEGPQNPWLQPAH